MKGFSTDIPIELAVKIGSYDVQAAAKIAQLSKACNVLLRSKLNEGKQKWKFERMVAQLFPFRFGINGVLEERDYRDAISFQELVEWWSSSNHLERFRLFESLVVSVNIASVVCLFAETDELQLPLLRLFGEYQRLVKCYNIQWMRMYSDSKRMYSNPKLFVESYAGRPVDSMRPLMLKRQFEAQIRRTWRGGMFPFRYHQGKNGDICEDLLDVLRRMKMDHVDYLMRFVTMLTMKNGFSG